MSSSKIYTRTGDKGKTSLVSGTRVSKGNLRLDAYGTVDELNSLIGVVIAELHEQTNADNAYATGEGGELAICGFLKTLQSLLFNVGSQLACEDAALRAKIPSVGPEAIKALEEEMDLYSADLPALKNFILPGGTLAAAHAHVARTVCRRAERHCVLMVDQGEIVEDILIQFINRLSDYLFVLARRLNHLSGISEPIWKS